MSHPSDGNSRRARLHRWLIDGPPSGATALRLVAKDPHDGSDHTLRTWLASEVTAEHTAPRIDSRINDYADECEAMVKAHLQWIDGEDRVINSMRLQGRPSGAIQPVGELDGSLMSQLKQQQAFTNGMMMAVFKVFSDLNGGWQALFGEYQRAFSLLVDKHTTDDNRLATYEQIVDQLRAQLAELQADAGGEDPQTKVVEQMLNVLTQLAASNPGSMMVQGGES